MSAKKAPEPTRITLASLDRLLLRPFRGDARPVALAVVIVGMFVGFWCVIWTHVREDVLSAPDYWLTEEGLEITSLPPWIHSDVRAEGYRDASVGVVGPLSIMDPKLPERISKAFSVHPWVAKVERVQKLPGGRVKVDLLYRQPVCIVEAPDGLHPVDAAGVVLPIRDFSAVEIANYPLLVGINTMPVGPEGTRWGDPRVLGGAEIAAVLGKVWKEFQLARIVPVGIAEGGRLEEYLYELQTHSGTRITWGRAPGTTMTDEVPAAVKLSRLKEHKVAFGTLEGSRGPQQLDVRTMRSVQASQ